MTNVEHEVTEARLQFEKLEAWLSQAITGRDDRDDIQIKVEELRARVAAAIRRTG